MVFLIDAIFPRSCPACAQDTRAPLLCPTCAESLYETDDACVLCALPRHNGSCPCGRHDQPLMSIRAPYLYGSELAVTLQRLKYERRTDIAWEVGRWISAGLADFCRQVGADFIVPMPSHWTSRFTRGMDPILEILSGARAQLPIVRALRKTRRTSRQASLPRKRRLGNLQDSLRVPRQYRPTLRRSTVVIFDDIVTTMATVDEASRSLASAGCQAIAAFAVARSDQHT